jgi:hypothetical protein
MIAKTIEKTGREDALRKEGESESQYISFFKNDYLKSKEGMEKNIGNRVYAYFILTENPPYFPKFF